MKWILSLDQGTTSSRSVLFDHKGSLHHIESKPITQYYPREGWVEHDPEEIWRLQLETAETLLEKKKIKTSDIEAISITNQRETTVLWDKRTSKPIYNAIVWQDRRTAKLCKSIQSHKETILTKTGLVIDPYFSATKIAWILENIPTAKSLMHEGNLLFGTIDTWLIWKLTEGKLHVTDPSNASRTMLFNINTLDWDDELCEIFNIDKSILPKVVDSSEVIGKASLLKGIPIAAIAGDQQAALFGQLCLEKGMVKNTYGTACCMLMNLGSKPILSKHSLLTSIGWKIGKETFFVLEGSILSCADVINWLKNELNLFADFDEMEKMLQNISNDHITFIPSFTGLGSPHWNPYARGTIFGISAKTKKEQLISAALEGIAHQVADIFDVMQKDSKTAISEVRIDGGLSNSNWLL